MQGRHPARYIKYMVSEACYCPVGAAVNLNEQRCLVCYLCVVPSHAEPTLASDLL